MKKTIVLGALIGALIGALMGLALLATGVTAAPGACDGAECACEPVETVQGHAVINGEMDIFHDGNGNQYQEWETLDIGGRHFVGYLYRAGRPDLHPTSIFEVYAQWNPALGVMNFLIWEPTGTYQMDAFDDDEFFVKVGGDKRELLESVRADAYLWEFSVEWNLADFGQPTEIHLLFDGNETGANVFCFGRPTALTLAALDAASPVTTWLLFPFALLGLLTGWLIAWLWRGK